MGIGLISYNNYAARKIVRKLISVDFFVGLGKRFYGFIGIEYYFPQKFHKFIS